MTFPNDSVYEALLCAVGIVGAAGACVGYVRGRAERSEWGTDHHRAMRQAEQAERRSREKVRFPNEQY